MIKRILTEDDLSSGGSTIVIASYNGADKSKIGADIIINEGENAAKKINDAIQSLKGTGGEIKLMEGTYQIRESINLNVGNVHLTGLLNGTVLYIPMYINKIIDTTGLDQNRSVTISNLYIIGHGKANTCFYLKERSKVLNCFDHNSAARTCWLRDKSMAINCYSLESERLGFYAHENAKLFNCISRKSKENGFSLHGESVAKGCLSEQSGANGYDVANRAIVTCSISKNSTSNGISAFGESTVTFNTLINDSLNDSSRGMVKYNALEGR